MRDEAAWFAPKRFGVGAGRPISWQGWVLLAAYIAVVIGAALTLGHRPVALAAIVIPATLLLMLITARTTRGGWRWRWGSKD